MNKIPYLLILILLSGCTFSREMTVTAKIKDGQYIAAKGSGNALYQSKTSFSLFCKSSQEK